MLQQSQPYLPEPLREVNAQGKAAIFRSLGADWYTATVVMQLASVVMLYAHSARALQLIAEAVPIFRARNHQGSIGVALNFQGWGYLLQGEFDLSLSADGLLAAMLMTGLMISAPASSQLSRHIPALRLMGAGLR